MKYFFLILLLIARSAAAQNGLEFNKRFVQSENKWVAYEKGKDDTYIYGFIYIDAQAGMTLNYEGTFKILNDGTFVPEKLSDSQNANMKVRLQPNNVKVAFIPENKFSELKIPATPDWLKNYLGDSGSVKRLYRWGYLYNEWEECGKALTYLERAYSKEPEFTGLVAELAFSYNCLKRYDKAIDVLSNAISSNPTDAYFHKELVYAQIKSGLLDKAAATCKKAVAVCKPTYNGENTYNLLHEYYEKKDKKNFAEWLPETKKWNATNEKLLGSIEYMQKDLK